MSIEFIPAKDLPVAEGDEVDVLCVENGELKRKEGASLGGRGYDIVITTTDNENFALVTGTYEEIKAKALAGYVLKGVVLANITEEASGVTWHETYPVLAVQVPESDEDICVESAIMGFTWLVINSENAVYID